MVQSDHPVAYDSPDHLAPHGTAENSIRHWGFTWWATRRFGRGAYLDVGCARGDVALDMARIGWTAVGLEGSDYNLVNGRWPKDYDGVLFTCDVGQPFLVVEYRRTRHHDRLDHLISFDLITAWQVLEHLDLARIKTLTKNIAQHSKVGTMFIAPTGQTSEKPQGIELHVTRLSSTQWVELLLRQLGPGWRVAAKPPPRCFQVRRCVDRHGQTVALERVA